MKQIIETWADGERTVRTEDVPRKKGLQLPEPEFKQEYPVDMSSAITKLEDDKKSLFEFMNKMPKAPLVKWHNIATKADAEIAIGDVVYNLHTGTRRVYNGGLKLPGEISIGAANAKQEYPNTATQAYLSDIQFKWGNPSAT